jgi:tyramine---L-glutamate ligase
LNILLYEHLSSGGFAGKPIPPSLLSEGYAMLRGLTSDFKASGHQTNVLLDSRIAAFKPAIEAEKITEIYSSNDIGLTFEKISKNADAAYIIAPETDRIIETCINLVQKSGLISLNCQITAISNAASKTKLQERTRRLDLSFPKTKHINSNETASQISQIIKKDINFPAVIKPNRGAGCEGLHLVKNEMQVEEIFNKIKEEMPASDFIIQEILNGTPVSISLISNGNEALPISLNLQDVALSSSKMASCYKGGTVPYDHPLKMEAFKAAKRIVESYTGLSGYVGVDMILTSSKVFILEINPRLTTSYVGLRKISDFNIAEATKQAVTKTEIPKNPKTNGYSCFSKIILSHLTEAERQEISQLEETVAPPFPIAENDISYALIQSQGKTFTEASNNLESIRKNIRNISKVKTN